MPGDKVMMGSIIKHTNNGVGFKITFPDIETANRYKDMIRWILLDDKKNVVYNIGYYDTYKDMEANEK